MSNQNGRFGIHGGQYIPETLMNAVIELEEAYNHYKADPEFNRELTALLNDYAGRPSRLYFAKKMTADLGGAKIWLKREDLPPRKTRTSVTDNLIEWFRSGLTVEEITSKLDGNTCGFRNTSCPDQLAKAVRQAYEEENR